MKNEITDVKLKFGISNVELTLFSLFFKVFSSLEQNSLLISEGYRL